MTTHSSLAGLNLADYFNRSKETQNFNGAQLKLRYLSGAGANPQRLNVVQQINILQRRSAAMLKVSGAVIA